MLDINMLRVYKGGDPEKVRESQRRRFKDEGIVDTIIAADEVWRGLVKQADDARSAKNAKQMEITKLKKAKQEVPAALMVELKALDKTRAELEAQTEPQLAVVMKLLSTVGNIVDDSVPVSKDEAKNEVVSKWDGALGVQPKAAYSHHELLYMIGGYEPERGVRVAGHRGYFLTDCGVLLNQAIIQYGIAFVRKRKYKVMQPPYMMNKEIMAGVAQLEEFDEALYSVNCGSEDKYLIATSEQPICAYHKDEWIKEQDLPKRYCGVSTCFRKEAGSHGRDTWGIFRVHQFEKVEQFCMTDGKLETSQAMHQEMIDCAEDFVKSFGFAYHVVNIVSGELNNAAIKKYDLECWFPFQQQYRELVSCSNCTDYQSRSMEIRCGLKKMGQTDKKYVHMLNSTLAACGRTICCLLETYQTAEGVTIPECLQNFMGGMKFMPYVRNMDGTPFVSKVVVELSPEAQALTDKLAAQGEAVRALKAAKASKEEITAAVDVLKAFKAQLQALSGEEPPKKDPKKEQEKKAPAPPQQPKKAAAPQQQQQQQQQPKQQQQPAAPPAAPKGNGELDSLEAQLTLRPFLEGFSGTKADALAFAKIEKAQTNLGAYPNVARWMSHVKTFDEATRKAW